VFKIGQGSSGAAVPYQEFEGIEFETGLWVIGEKLLQGRDALGGGGHSCGCPELSLLRIGLLVNRRRLTVADEGNGHYDCKKHAK
jgi:hypothetical protein